MSATIGNFSRIFPSDLFGTLPSGKTKTEFSCNYCKKLYKEKHNLNKHINNKHIIKEDYTCSNCGKMFQQKQSLTRHDKNCHRR